MEFCGQHSRSASGREQISDQLGADRHTRGNLAILARVAVIRDHRSNASRRRSFEGIEHQQQLHEVVIAWGTDRLDHEHVAAPHILGNLNRDLTVTESANLRGAHLHS